MAASRLASSAEMMACSDAMSAPSSSASAEKKASSSSSSSSTACPTAALCPRSTVSSSSSSLAVPRSAGLLVRAVVAERQHAQQLGHAPAARRQGAVHTRAVHSALGWVLCGRRSDARSTEGLLGAQLRAGPRPLRRAVEQQRIERVGFGDQAAQLIHVLRPAEEQGGVLDDGLACEKVTKLSTPHLQLSARTSQCFLQRRVQRELCNVISAKNQALGMQGAHLGEERVAGGRRQALQQAVQLVSVRTQPLECVALDGVVLRRAQSAQPLNECGWRSPGGGPGSRSAAPLGWPAR